MTPELKSFKDKVFEELNALLTSGRYCTTDFEDYPRPFGAHVIQFGRSDWKHCGAVLRGWFMLSNPSAVSCPSPAVLLQFQFPKNGRADYY